MNGMIHIAACRVEIGGRYIRQRCGWCGATLADYDMARIVVPEGQEPTPPATWPGGSLVLVEEAMSYDVAHTAGDPLPDNACARLDPAVTA